MVELNEAAIAGLSFARQGKAAWGGNAVLMEQVCKGRRREDTVCHKIKMKRYMCIIKSTF